MWKFLFLSTLCTGTIYSRHKAEIEIAGDCCSSGKIYTLIALLFSSFQTSSHNSSYGGTSGQWTTGSTLVGLECLLFFVAIKMWTCWCFVDTKVIDAFFNLSLHKMPVWIVFSLKRSFAKETRVTVLPLGQLVVAEITLQSLCHFGRFSAWIN